MAKRSPILGYNHNVRYRGLVFHVQTEDSGVATPHVFTHLFHGGVILSTRKLVYDAGASEDVIRSLMQAQHKAVLKELRRASFDDKIDEYLGGTPGLLPRGAGATAADATTGDDAIGSEGGPTEPIPIIDEAMLTESAAPIEDASTEALPEAILLESATPEEIAAQETIPIELPPVPPPLPPTRTTVPLPGIPRPKTGPVPPIVTFRDEAAPDLAAAAQAAAAAAAAASAAAPVESMTSARETGRVAIAAASLPPPPAARPATAPRITSAAPPRPAITPPVVVARDLDLPGTDSAEIYSPPPPSADLPPGMHENPGAYSVRRRDATSDPTPARPPVPSPRPTAAPAQARPAARPSAPAMARPVTPPALPVVRPAVPSPPAAAPRARPTGGVVMSRPAVIVGAPRTSPPPTKGKAGDDDRRGFGQGLISEKSLDEVILAYLSEDAADE